MKAIRGAITVEADSPEEIRCAVKELLLEIKQQNHLTEDDILFILFSNTADIHSLYPAKAAREAGFAAPALFSAAEPMIDGALPLCIRVMVFAENCNAAKHIYLRGAAVLRKDLKRFSVALDGPSGSGKSTIAKKLAKEYNILYLDTGAMYRACALQAIDDGIDLKDEKAVGAMLARMRLHIEYENGIQHTYLGDRDVSEEIRRPEVSMAASDISALRCVRMKMVDMQREIAAKMSCVLDGRDIGSYVLPNAEFKFYITASVAVRAKRRYSELKAKGYDVDLNMLEKEIEQRDRNDSTREFSPLVQADDAVYVDTSDMTVEQVVSFIKSKIQEKV